MLRRLRNTRGFTLVELLVVIAILALIGGIAVPRYIDVLRDAKGDADDGEEAMVQAAIDRYVFDQENLSTPTSKIDIYKALTGAAGTPLEATHALKANASNPLVTGKYIKGNSVSLATFTIDQDLEIQ